MPPRDSEQLNTDRLARWLARQLTVTAGSLTVKQFIRGKVNLTYLLSPVIRR